MHAFVKKTPKTSKNDLDHAIKRYRGVMPRVIFVNGFSKGG
jgi:phage-related protein